MKLKIDKIGTLLTEFTYSIAQSNTNSVIVSILFKKENSYGGYQETSRIYHLFPDSRHQLQSILNLTNNAFQITKGTLKITTDVSRNYVNFIYPKNNNDQFTGYYI